MASNMRHCLRVLPLAQQSVTAIRSVAFSTSFLNSAKVQEGFEGLQAGFVWDHKHGFGYAKDGKVVIVSPQAINIATPTGIEDDETESILEMAKETYRHERKSSQEGAEHGPQNN